jgi:hypothetical protein
MIFQTDERIGVPPVDKSGCFVMAAFYCAAVTRRKGFSPEEIGREIVKMQNEMVSDSTLPIIEKDMYVNSYDDIAIHFGIRPITRAYKVYPNDPVPDDCLIIAKLKLTTGYHAAVIDKAGRRIYDPLGCISYHYPPTIVDARILMWAY